MDADKLKLIQDIRDMHARLLRKHGWYSFMLCWWNFNGHMDDWTWSHFIGHGNNTALERWTLPNNGIITPSEVPELFFPGDVPAIHDSYSGDAIEWSMSDSTAAMIRAS